MQRPTFLSRLATLAGIGARRFPDFLGIGAQRGGTTWLHANLSRHPGIWLPPAKEMHYFDQANGIEADRWAPLRRAYLSGLTAVRTARAPSARPGRAERELLRWAAHYADSAKVDDDWYAGLFAAAPRRALLGDITPAYALLDATGVAHVARLVPRARIIFMLRHPAERMLSGAWHELMFARAEGPPPSLDAFLEELRSVRCRSRSAYHRTLSEWGRSFPAEQFKILFHDDVVHRPHDVLREVCAHLRVDHDRRWFPDAAAPVNVGRGLPEAYRREGWRIAVEACRDELRLLPGLIGPLPPGWN